MPFLNCYHLGKIIIKQALPYVRLVGDSWPLTLERAFFEYNALVRQEERDPNRVPAIHFFDRSQGLIAMEYLESHKILRGKLILGEEVSTERNFVRESLTLVSAAIFASLVYDFVVVAKHLHLQTVASTTCMVVITAQSGQAH